MSPADRSAHWTAYRWCLAVAVAVTLGVPLVLHLVLTLLEALP